jgi:glucokinase
MAVIGLDLGGTKLASAIFQPDGNTINKVTLSLEKRGGDEASRMITASIADQYRYADERGMQIEAIGCCIPGIVYSGTGRVWAPNISGWEDYPLLDRIREEIHNRNIGIALDNDRACCIMGEVWQGTARGCRNAVFLAVGTGIGAGIMIDGRILRGISDIAGAIGWLALDQPYQEKYAPFGCFEYNASGDGLARIAREYIRNDTGYSGMLSNLRPEEINAHCIIDAFRKNDPIAIAVMKNAVTYWGMAIANLVSLFNPEKIVMGGGVFGPAVLFLDQILSEARKWAQPISIQQMKLEVSTLEGDAGLIGAGFLAMTNKHRKYQ